MRHSNYSHYYDQRSSRRGSRQILSRHFASAPYRSQHYQKKELPPSELPEMSESSDAPDSKQMSEQALEETKSETCAQTESSVELTSVDSKAGQLVVECDRNKLAAHHFVKIISHLEQELQEEKKKRKEAEERLFDLLFINQTPNKKVDAALVCMAEGKPNYGSYAHLVENKSTTGDLLDLVNEELKNKHILLRKIANKVGPISELSKEDKDELNQIVNGFAK